jgi:hypothetical protein
MSDNFELKFYVSDEEDSIFDADDINFENDTVKYDDKTNDSYYKLDVLYGDELLYYPCVAHMLQLAIKVNNKGK